MAKTGKEKDKNWFFAGITIAIFLSGVSFYFSNELRTQSQLQKARVDNVVNLLTIDSLMNRDSLIRELQVEKSKKDLYLTHLTIQSDKYLLYISLLFVVIGFINFFYFFTEGISSIRKNNEEMKNQQEEWINNQNLYRKRHEQRVSELEIGAYKTYSNVHLLASNTVGLEEADTYILNRLHSIKYTIKANSIENKGNISPKLQKMIIQTLTPVYNIFNNLDKYSLSEDQLLLMEPHLKSILKELLNINNEAISGLLLRILSKIPFKTM